MTAADLIAQLIAEMEAAAPRPDEFTVNTFAQKAGLTVKRANYKLECLVNDGKLRRRKGSTGQGREQWLYSSATNKE